MCLIAFAWKQHPKFDLILAANRDEIYDRPARAAQWWKKNPHVLAGKDCKSGGTWLGINRDEQFAALTNYRDSALTRKNAPSRGHIVLGYLKNDITPTSFLRALDQRSSIYNGFNLLAGNGQQLFHYSNQEQKINRVRPGVHGLSNHLLDTPWPKVKRSTAALKKLIEQETINRTALFDLLRDDREADESELPQTGIPKEAEKQISPVFIKTNNYGTRCSTILLIDKHGKVTFEEQRYKKGTTKVEKTSRFTYEVDHTHR